MATEYPVSRVASSVITVAPFGGKGVSEWDDKSHTAVRGIVLYVGDFIHGIQVEYDDDGKSVSVHHGSYDGRVELVRPDYPAEVLTSISGYYGTDSEGGNSTVLRSLTIQSNTKTYGPFGTETGTRFSFPPSSGSIIGLLGRSSSTSVDAIGAYLQYPRVRIIGLWFEPMQSKWDHGFHTGIRRLTITADTHLRSIAVEYDDNGHSVTLTAGQSDMGTKYSVPLDYPDEYVVSISGTAGYVSNDDHSLECIHSIAIQTNKNEYGPYGEPGGDAILTTSHVAVGKVIGFVGATQDVFITRIAVYLEQ